MFGAMTPSHLSVWESILSIHAQAHLASLPQNNNKEIVYFLKIEHQIDIGYLQAVPNTQVNLTVRHRSCNCLASSCSHTQLMNLTQNKVIWIHCKVTEKVKVRKSGEVLLLTEREEEDSKLKQSRGARMLYVVMTLVFVCNNFIHVVGAY
ncbi:hypothetical protein E2C01_044182 [Portunus trituberculatus]|uniref:Uncharacterized protein n=1 Tax=Portunus trituberculatus TaxID=210409 RepID=A0A5B7G1K8_PORTR|nr:hypothetical protein [Portunus trituberculatus]